VEEVGVVVQVADAPVDARALFAGQIVRSASVDRR
jgi:hypothetical protein